MKNKVITMLLCAAMSVSIAGCGNAVELDGEPEIIKETQSEEAIVSSETIPSETISEASFEETTGTQTVPVEKQDMAGSNFGNSILVTDMAYEAAGGNVMFSPLSLNFALGMVLEGTDGESPTRTVLEQYLNNHNYSAFVKSYLEYAEKVAELPVPEGSTMENHYDIANAVWVNRDYPLKQQYQTSVTDSYRAETENLDFSDPDKVCARVNSWVKEKTRSMIPSILSPDLIQKDTTAVLTNAIYFESPWANEWDVYRYEKEFTNLDGSICEPVYLTSSCGTYFSNDKATAFAKEYSNGLEFIGILPNETGEFTLEELDIEGLLATRETIKTSIMMPELNFETNIKLTGILRSLGMEVMFSKYADITEMCDEEVMISEVIQKTKLELDDKGTKAAAITAVIVNKASAMELERMEQVVLDRPFAFLIYDTENQVPVFMGKVTNLSE